VANSGQEAHAEEKRMQSTQFEYDGKNVHLLPDPSPRL